MLQRTRLRRALCWTAAAVFSATAFVACRDDTVLLTYRPEAGDRSEYEVVVRSRSTVDIPGSPKRVERDEVVLRAEHVVISADDEGSRVEVRLRPLGADPSEARTFVVRLDRAAQLAEIEEVEGLPAAILGDLGLAEIFPPAAGQTPARRLQPGERWRLDDPVDLPDTGVARMSGRGRLAELRVEDGTSIGVVETITRLPVRRQGSTDQGAFQLVGEQETDSRTGHNIEDGAVEWSESVTTASYRLSLAPPDGGTQRLEGSLEVRVQSRTRRLS